MLTGTEQEERNDRKKNTKTIVKSTQSNESSDPGSLEPSFAHPPPGLERALVHGCTARVSVPSCAVPHLDLGACTQVFGGERRAECRRERFSHRVVPPARSQMRKVASLGGGWSLSM